VEMNRVAEPDVIVSAEEKETRQAIDNESWAMSLMLVADGSEDTDRDSLYHRHTLSLVYFLNLFISTRQEPPTPHSYKQQFVEQDKRKEMQKGFM